MKITNKKLGAKSTTKIYKAKGEKSPFLLCDRIRLQFSCIVLKCLGLSLYCGGLFCFVLEWIVVDCYCTALCCPVLEWVVLFCVAY